MFVLKFAYWQKSLFERKQMALEKIHLYYVADPAPNSAAVTGISDSKSLTHLHYVAEISARRDAA